MTPRSGHVAASDWLTMSVEDYFRWVERAQILAKMVAADPTDIEARVTLGKLRRQGLDVPDPEWVLGFDPEVLSILPPPPPPAPEPPARDGSTAEPLAKSADEWADSILEEALGFISVGLKARALPLLEIVLHMQPENDVARSWLFALKADTGGERMSPDATLRIELPR
jgi:hypothetical protein